MKPITVSRQLRVQVIFFFYLKKLNAKVVSVNLKLKYLIFLTLQPCTRPYSFYCMKNYQMSSSPFKCPIVMTIYFVKLWPFLSSRYLTTIPLLFNLYEVRTWNLWSFYLRLSYGYPDPCSVIICEAIIFLEKEKLFRERRVVVFQLAGN